MDARYGVCCTGDPADVATLGASQFYLYSSVASGLPVTGAPPGQVGLVRPVQTISALLAQAVAANRGRVWLMGNEPNNLPSDGDGITPEAYAVWLHEMATLIFSIDPTARLAGPGTLNWTRETGTTLRGRDWAQRMIDHYNAVVDPGHLPFSVWTLHTYGMDFTRLPTQDRDGDCAEIDACRASVSGWGWSGMPIWVTEFGAVIGDDGGNYRDDLLAAYLDAYVPALRSSPSNVGAWFLFASRAAGRASYAVLPDGRLNAGGARYREYALGLR